MPALRERPTTPRIDPPRPRARDHGSETPIFDRERRLIGWTRKRPILNGGRLHHGYAERLVGGPILCAYVQVDDPVAAQRAGAPPDWKEPWRCLALCAEDAA